MNVHTLSDIKRREQKENTLKQVSERRNTTTVSATNRQRARTWFFTLNNFNESEVTQLTGRYFIYLGKKIEIYKYLFQEEIGKKSKIRHLQGVIYFKNEVSFDCVKSFLPRANLGQIRNWSAALNYCSKGFTREGEVYRYKCRENRKVEHIDRESIIKWVREQHKKEIPLLANEVSKDLSEIDLEI